MIAFPHSSTSLHKLRKLTIVGVLALSMIIGSIVPTQPKVQAVGFAVPAMALTAIKQLATIAVSWYIWEQTTCAQLKKRPCPPGTITQEVLRRLIGMTGSSTADIAKKITDGISQLCTSSLLSMECASGGSIAQFQRELKRPIQMPTKGSPHSPKQTPPPLNNNRGPGEWQKLLDAFAILLHVLTPEKVINVTTLFARLSVKSFCGNNKQCESEQQKLIKQLEGLLGKENLFQFSSTLCTAFTTFPLISTPLCQNKFLGQPLTSPKRNQNSGSKTMSSSEVPEVVYLTKEQLKVLASINESCYISTLSLSSISRAALEGWSDIHNHFIVRKPNKNLDKIGGIVANKISDKLSNLYSPLSKLLENDQVFSKRPLLKKELGNLIASLPKNNQKMTVKELNKFMLNAKNLIIRNNKTRIKHNPAFREKIDNVIHQLEIFLSEINNVYPLLRDPLPKDTAQQITSTMITAISEVISLLGDLASALNKVDSDRKAKKNWDISKFFTFFDQNNPNIQDVNKLCNYITGTIDFMKQSQRKAYSFHPTIQAYFIHRWHEQYGDGNPYYVNNSMISATYSPVAVAHEQMIKAYKLLLEAINRILNS